MLKRLLIDEVAEEFITFYLVCVLSKTSSYKGIESLSLQEIANSINHLRAQHIRFLSESVDEIRRNGRIRVLMQFFFIVFAVCERKGKIVLKLKLLRESHREKFNYIMKIFSELYGIKFSKINQYVYVSQ
jgi:hypothetical protein